MVSTLSLDWAMLVEVEAKVFGKELMSKWTKFKFRAHGSYVKLGGDTNEKFIVGSQDNFDVQSARRVLKKHLEFVRNTGGVISLINDHIERNHNIHGVGAVGSIRKKGNPSRPSYLQKLQ
jgi:hypothetical protein